MGDIPLSQIRLNGYFHLISCTILVYDHILTFGDEYKHIWKNPRSGASILFLINRYYAFLSNIAMTAGNFYQFNTVERSVSPFPTNQPPFAYGFRSCQHYSTYRLANLITTQIIVAIIQYLRTYALYGRRWRVAALMLGIGIILVAVAAWAAIGPSPAVSLNEGCTIASPRHVSVRYVVAWEALLVWDLLVFALTFAKTYRERFLYAAVMGRRNDLLSLIVRDGAVYFAVMACVQCANCLTYYLCPPALIGVLSTFSSTISVSMISRLMLNLHRTAPRARAEATTTTAPPGYVMTSGFGFAPLTQVRHGDADTGVSGLTTGTYEMSGTVGGTSSGSGLGSSGTWEGEGRDAVRIQDSKV